MKLVEDLKREVDRCVRAIEALPTGRALIAGTVSTESYLVYLATARVAVAKAEDFLVAAADQLAAEGGAPELVALLRDKAQEEKGHVKWIDRDSRELGARASDLHGPRPSPAGAVYVDFHESIRRVAGSGAGFLGSAYVLESLSKRLAGQVAANLRAHATDPALRAGKGLLFLRGHHAEDQAHVAELERALERHVTRPQDCAWIALCARFTATVYPGFFA